MNTKPLQSIGIAYHNNAPEVIQTSQAVEKVLLEQGAKHVLRAPMNTDEMLQAITDKNLDALIVLGGDGTMLRASQLCAPAGVPITGINQGTFGFLFEMEKNNWKKYIPRLIQGDFRLEERMMLKAEHLRGERSLGSWQVVNEIVVCRGQEVKPIRIHAYVDKYRMASYVADGLIAATATGSTAYALAVDGPIMPPETRNILVVPVAPHLSFDRAVILSEGACITISVQTQHEAVLSADGREPIRMINEDSVRVSASDQNIQFIRFHGPGFFYRHLNRYMQQNPTV
jgi:NAD+ kinase